MTCYYVRAAADVRLRFSSQRIANRAAANKIHQGIPRRCVVVAVFITHLH